MGVRGLLGLAAQHARLELERQARRAVAPEPPLAAFAKLALDRLQEIRAHAAAAAPVFLGHFGLETYEAPPVISAAFPVGRYGTAAVAEVSLVGHERGLLSCQCDCSNGLESCGHLRVLLEAVLDTIFGPPSRLKTWIVEALSVPTWRRQLDAISNAQVAEPHRAERLVWRSSSSCGT